MSYVTVTVNSASTNFGCLRKDTNQQAVRTL